MLAYWFSKICFLSLAGSGAALAVWAICHLTGRRLSCRWRYYIWLIPLILLLLPIVPLRTARPAAPTPEPVQAVQPEVLPAAAPDTLPEAPAASGGTAASAAETTAAAPGPLLPAQKERSADRLPLLEVLGWLWLGGAAVLAIRHGASAFRLRRFLRRTAGRAEPWEEVLLEEQRIALKLRRPVALCRYMGAGTPFLYGLVRPAIYLPGAILSREELGPVLAHELIHCRRRDLLVKQLAWLARTVHWFNPLAWLAEREVDYRCELACDEAATAGMDPAGRRAYA